MKDTRFSMTWNEFLTVISDYGFKEGLKYEFKNEDYTEEAVLYYLEEKGLVIWATSWGNKDVLNGGTLYGQIKSRQPVTYTEEESMFGGTYKNLVITEDLSEGFASLSGCGHDAFMTIEEGTFFDVDIRTNALSIVAGIGEHFDFLPVWTEDRFIWFVDYKEEDKVDYKQASRDKVRRGAPELQNIMIKCLEEN